MLKINADCFDDVVAASAMNRPGPLSLKTPDLYAQNKLIETCNVINTKAAFEVPLDNYINSKQPFEGILIKYN